MIKVTPKQVQKFCYSALQPAAVITALTLLVGLYYSLIASPIDYQQGSMVRVMYVHVPAAWLAMFAYLLIASLSIGYIVWRNPLCYLIAREVAPLGAAFTFICLITGSIWGKPTWGTWWVWDARLTSVLVLFFLYLGFIAMRGAFLSDEKEAKSASILAIIGAINLPIIKYSVDWWNTLHQPAGVFRIDGSKVHESMLKPLIFMGIAFLALFLTVLCVRVLNALIQKELKRLNSKR